MTKRDDYFRKFEGVKPGEQRGLPVDGSERMKILYIDDGLASHIKSRILEIAPPDVDLVFCEFPRAVDELTGEEYSLVILPHGFGLGGKTLRLIKESCCDVPIIFEDQSRRYVDRYVRENVSAIIDFVELREGSIEKLIERYARE